MISRQLLEHSIVTEGYGGEVPIVPVRLSAVSNQIDNLADLWCYSTHLYDVLLLLCSASVPVLMVALLLPHVDEFKPLSLPAAVWR